MPIPPMNMFAPTPEAPYGRAWPMYPEEMVSELAQLPNGTVVKNPLIDGVDVWYQTFEPNAQIALAANGRTEGIWRIPPASGLRGDVELFYLMSQHTGRYTLQGHLVGSYDRFISNVPISVNCLAGTGQLPHELAESVFMESAGHVSWTLRDVSGVANNVQLVGFGRQFINYDIVGLGREPLIESFRQRASHPYYLSFDQTAPDTGGILLNANETRENATLEMTVPGDGDFICYGILDDSDFDWTLNEMRSGRSGKLNTSGNIPRSLFASLTTFGGVNERRAASYPLRWRQPRLFTRGTKISFRITNNVAAGNVIRLVLAGRKIYYPELGKQPIELLGRNLVPRPLATHGSGGAWQSALSAGAVAPGAMPGWPARPLPQPWRHD